MTRVKLVSSEEFNVYFANIDIVMMKCFYHFVSVVIINLPDGLPSGISIERVSKIWASQVAVVRLEACVLRHTLCEVVMSCGFLFLPLPCLDLS